MVSLKVLKVFRFVDEEGWSQKIGTPRIKFISIPEHIKGKLREEKKLKIAVIPAPEEKKFFLLMR